jgi:hypothetical protein
MKLCVLCALRGSGVSLFMNRQERQVREEAVAIPYNKNDAKG